MIGSRRARPAEALARADTGGANDQDILDFIARRRIEELLHFTTNLGVLGVLGSGLLLSRARLPENRYLEHVYQPNSNTRKDGAWLDFVNLSITNINEWMFDRSEAWHAQEDVWWACLSYDPAIMAEPGVVFTTTNNIYPSVERGFGVSGLEALFAPIVLGRYGYRHDRTGKTDAQPTDRQAEVLYPRAVDVSKLRGIYVRQDEHVDDIEGIFAIFPAAEVPVMVRPEVFQ
jgi:hypothetical protein